MASVLIAGVAYLKVDGNQYRLLGSFAIGALTTEKTGVAGQDGVHGYTEKPIVPSIEAEISDIGSLSVQALQQITSSTVTAELANGKVYVLGGAWVSGMVSLDATMGKIKVKFEGMTMNEQVPSS